MSGTTVDASIALNANAPKPVNPLVQMGQFAQTAGGLANLQQAQIAIAKQNALADAYRGAPLDPRTGMPDQAYISQALQGTRYGPLALPGAIKAVQELNAGALKQSVDRANAYGAAFAPVVALGANATPSDVFGAVKRLQAFGTPGTDQMVNDIAQNMPMPDPSRAGDPAYQKQYGTQLQQYVRSRFIPSLPAPTQLQAVTPDLHAIDNGPSINLVNTQPLAGPIASYGSIQKGNPPEVSTNIQQIGVDSQGRKIMGTRAQAIAEATGGALNGAFGAPAGAPPVAGAPSQPGAAAPAPAATGAVPGGGFVGGLGPAEEADLKNTADASIAQYNQAHAAVNGYAGRLVQLQQALHGLQNSPTGPGAETVNEIKSFLLAQGPAVLQSLGITDPNQIASFDKANKYLTQYATNAATAFGAGTDHQLAATLTGNASTHISNLAAQDVVKTATALERMKAAQMQAFDQSGLPPHEFNKWSVGWQKNIDPRAFEFDLLTPDQRNALVKSLGKPGSAPYEAFAQKLLAAQRSGFITPPAQNASP